MTLYSKLL